LDIISLIGAVTAQGFSVNSLIFAVGIYVIIKAIQIAENIIKKRLDSDVKIKATNKRKKANEVIYDNITEALVKFGGERIMVIEFSNGNKNVATIPYIYMDATYEVVRLGVETFADKMQRVLTSLFGKFLINLSMEQYLILSTVEQNTDYPPNVYYYMTTRKTQSTLYVALLNPKNKDMIGYICYDNNDQKLTDENIARMRSLADSISMLLAFGSDWD